MVELSSARGTATLATCRNQPARRDSSTVSAHFLRNFSCGFLGSYTLPVWHSAIVYLQLCKPWQCWYQGFPLGDTVGAEGMDEPPYLCAAPRGLPTMGHSPRHPLRPPRAVSPCAGTPGAALPCWPTHRLTSQPVPVPSKVPDAQGWGCPTPGWGSDGP